MTTNYANIIKNLEATCSCTMAGREGAAAMRQLLERVAELESRQIVGNPDAYTVGLQHPHWHEVQLTMGDLSKHWGRHIDGGDVRVYAIYAIVVKP